MLDWWEYLDKTALEAGLREWWEWDLLAAYEVNLADARSLGGWWRAAAWWRQRVRYRHDGTLHRIRPLSVCLARGYGSCGDACAFVGAAARRAGHDVAVCVEELPTYKHVRLVLDGNTSLEVLPEVRLPVGSCLRLISLP